MFALRQGLCGLLCRPGWPSAHRSSRLCVLSAGNTAVCYPDLLQCPAPSSFYLLESGFYNITLAGQTQICLPLPPTCWGLKLCAPRWGAAVIKLMSVASHNTKGELREALTGNERGWLGTEEATIPWDFGGKSGTESSCSSFTCNASCLSWRGCSTNVL